MTSLSTALAEGEAWLKHTDEIGDPTWADLNDARRVVATLLEALREVTEGQLTQAESDVIRKEIEEGTPNTPQRLATMKRADEAYRRSMPRSPSPAARWGAMSQIKTEPYRELAWVLFFGFWIVGFIVIALWPWP